jgi:hypothetical protein
MVVNSSAEGNGQIRHHFRNFFKFLDEDDNRSTFDQAEIAKRRADTQQAPTAASVAVEQEILAAT